MSSCEKVYVQLNENKCVERSAWLYYETDYAVTGLAQEVLKANWILMIKK